MNPSLADELEAINSIYGPSTVEPASTSDTDTYILQIPRESSLPPLAVRISFPSSYPERPPSILGIHVQIADGSGAGHVQLARAVLEKVHTSNTVVLFDFIEELRLVLLSSVYPSRQVDKSLSPDPAHEPLHAYDSPAMYRCIFYFHHIYSSKKIKHLHDLAQTYRLAGIMKTSRPGFLYAQTLPSYTASSTREAATEEGNGSRTGDAEKEILEAFIKEVKGMRWQEAKVVYFEATDTEPTKGVNGVEPRSLRNSGKRQDQQDAARPGFTQVEKMSDFSAWMHERGLSEILKESVLR